MKELDNELQLFAHPKGNMDTMPFYVGKLHNLWILDPYLQALYLNRALLFLENYLFTPKSILFLSGGKESQKITTRYHAKKLNQCSWTTRWIGGTLTNSKVIQERYFRNLNKKSYIQKHEEFEFYQNFPKVLFVIQPYEHSIAIHEANLSNIPVVGIVDNDTKIQGLDYYILGNDTSLLFTRKLYKTFYTIKLKAYANTKSSTKTF